MDAFNDPEVEFVTLMTSSQIGKTEIVNNIIGYYIEHDPAPMLLIMPTLEMGNAWSKDRFAPMLRDTPSLRGKVTDARAKDSSNTILHKVFMGGHITIAGANSPASLASRPVRIVLFDEVDRFPPSAGTEGDPVKLGTKRTQNFWNRKVFHNSTPTTKGVSRIESLWEESDQRYYYVPCPHCGGFQRLVWHQVKWEKGNLDSVRYECIHCHSPWSEYYKSEIIEKGEWRADHPERRRHAGFRINELYSPWSTWRNVVESFLEAEKQPPTLKVWVNTTLGETWEDEESYTISDAKLAARIEEYVELPQGVVLLTAGVDVQDDRIECLVKGWGKQDESWFVEYKTFYGTPAKPDVWRLLDDYLNQEWRHENGLTLRVVSACIDSGGHFTQNVYQYVQRREVKRFYAVKGMSGTGRPIVGRPSRNNKYRIHLFTIGVDTAKELIFARLQIEEAGPGYMHFSRNCDDEYFKQLTGEKQVTKFNKGFPTKVWVKTRTRNEALDCEVYALSAYTLLNVNMASLASRMETHVKQLTAKPPEGESTEQQAEPPKPRNRIKKVSRSSRRAASW